MLEVREGKKASSHGLERTTTPAADMGCKDLMRHMTQTM
jgi:hypothetical protein